MARSGIPPVTKFYLSVLIVCSVLTFILRYSTYIHLVTSEEHAKDHAHLINQATNQITDSESTQAIVPSPHEIYVPLIALIPGDITQLLWKPWIIFTTSFIEDGVISFIIAFFLILYTGRYIEVLWGSREFFNYLTTTVVLSNLLTYTILGIKWNFKDDGYIPITGSSPMILALLIAIKQRIPNHYLLFLDGFIRLRVSLVPFLVLLTTSILAFTTNYYENTNLLSWNGFFISWIYLRFYKEGGSGRQLSLLPIDDSVNHVSLAKGDRTGQFALSTFFPRPISTLVALISKHVFKLLVSLKLLRKEDFIDDVDESLDNEVLSSSNVTQNDLISSMTQSRLFTSSSLAGVSGKVSTFSLPKHNTLGTVFDKVRGIFSSKKSHSVNLQDSEAQRTVDNRRKLALLQLDSKITNK